MDKLQEKLKGSGLASSPEIGPDVDLNSCGRCTFCKDHINTKTNFKSSVTNKQFTLENSSAISVACETKNVVYLITCSVCDIQYVGMTEQTIKQRFSNHRTSCKNDKDKLLLYEHFRNHCRSLSDFKVQILYHYTGNKSAKDTLLAVEEFYMRMLGTLYPFGLNDKLTSVKLNLRKYDFTRFNSLNTPYFSFSSYCKRPKRSHGHRKRNKIQHSPNDFDTFIEELKNLFCYYSHNAMYTLLRSKSIRFLSHCVTYLMEIKKQCPP